MDKLKYIKLENEDGSYSNSIPLAVDSDHVDVNGNTLTNELSYKANNSSINNLQNQINSLASGSPLVASSTSEMTDTSRVYVNTTDGNWYYYDGDSWEVGGTYQSTQIANESINISHLGTDIKYNLNSRINNKDKLKILDNLTINFTNNIEKGQINVTTGQNQSSSNYYRSKNYIYIPPMTQLFFKINNQIELTEQNAYIVIYDENFNYITYKWQNQLICFKEGKNIRICVKTAYYENIEILLLNLNENNEYTHKINLFNKDSDKIITGCFNENGYYTSGNYNVSEIIPIKANTDYFISQARKLTFYDANFSYVEAKGSSSSNYNFSKAYNGYVQISYETSYANTLILAEGSSTVAYTPYQYYLKNNIKVNKDNLNFPVINNVLYGKKYVALGDSFTHGAFENSQTNDYTITEGLYAGQYKVYPYLIGNRNLMTVINLAVNGMTMAQKGTSTNVLSKDGGVYTQIPGDADYITIKIGINDNGHNIPVGTVDDNTNDTFCGAWNKVLPYLIEHYPNAKIGIIVTNGNQDNIEFANATINMAKKYGIAYYDEATDYTKPTLIRTNKTLIPNSINTIRANNWYVNNVNGQYANWHPNEKCHEFESYMIEDFLKSL